MERLPPELQENVLDRLSIKQIMSMRLVSKGYHRFIFNYLRSRLARKLDESESMTYTLISQLQQNHLATAKFLVSIGVEIDSALSYVVDNVHHVRWLVDHGANPTAYGSDAFVRAAQLGYLNTVKYLYEHGARNEEALQLAVDPDIIEFFLINPN